MAFAVASVAILAALAFAPLVQTWIAQAVLACHPSVQGSVGSLSAGFGRIEVEDLRLACDGAVFTLPSLQANLPLTAAAWNRKFHVRSLVAKGWTLDLTRLGEPDSARARAAGTATPVEAPSAQKVAGEFLGILNGLRLPGDMSLDGVDLEGDVLVGLASGTSTRFHVTVKGGGLAAGHEGAFAIDASDAIVGSDLSVTVFAAHGRLTVAMASTRTFSRFDFQADLSAKGGSLPDGLDLSADIAAVRNPGGEDASLDLSRGGRHFASVSARLPGSNSRIDGTWKIDLRDSDLAPFVPDCPLPTAAVTGDGRFDADAAFTRVNAQGRLKAVTSHWEVIAPALDRLGSAVLDASFELTHSGQTLQVHQFSVGVAASGSSALVQSLQSFAVNERTGSLRIANAHGDWIGGSFHGFPMAWLSHPNDRFVFADGEAAGQFAIRCANGAFTLRSKAPLVASGISLQHAGTTIGRGLDLSVPLLVDWASQGWQVEAAPFTVAIAGRRLATVAAKAARQAGADPSISITGTWNADLEALAAQAAIPGIHWIPGRAASGDFSASLGSPTEIEVKLTVAGHDPAKSVTGSVHADFNADGSVGILAPFKIATGSVMSDLSAEGTWSKDEAGVRVDAKVTGKDVALEHLRMLAAPAAAAAGVPISVKMTAGLGAERTDAGIRDSKPFWGDWIGSVTVGFDRLRAGNRDFIGVAGTFNIDPRSLRLMYGRAMLPGRSQATADGSVSFDAAAEFPYGLKAAADIHDVAAAPFFGELQKGKDPVLEGRFSVASKLAGQGATLQDLAARTQEEFHLTSTDGIIRLLKVNVAESLPEVTTPVSDALGTVGSFMGSLIGLKHDSTASSEIHLNKVTEAVLDFTNQVSEIGYEKMTLDAIRGPDRSIRIVNLEIAAPDERMTGSGRITYVEGVPIPAQPLSAELQFSARGRIADLLSTAGLLPAQRDKTGFTPMNQTVHFGGTLEHIDQSPWRDLLVKAATPKPDERKKAAQNGSP